MKRLALILAVALLARAEDGPTISDNSFLIEEAYNQDPGVVQHISTFERTRGGEWAYSFTQEWPAPNLTHQLSYTLNVDRDGISDVAAHYRYQLLSNDRVAVSPRVSLLVPTRDEAGDPAVQLMLPVSTVLTPRVVAHWNAGATFGNDAHEWTAGNSFVWLAHPRFNALVETVWTRSEVDGHADSEVVISPGIRWAYNFDNGLQIVPGLAVPMPVGPDHGERSIFLYLSFEHPFRRAQ
ncbi:MAG TPA: transporter [Thermoanaerobaculia bacterium]|nr:transporter [Thermoanaerobaculia bacterium]